MRNRRRPLSVAHYIQCGQGEIEKRLEQLDSEIRAVRDEWKIVARHSRQFRAALLARFTRLDVKAVRKLRRSAVAARLWGRRGLAELYTERDRLRAFLGNSLRSWEVFRAGDAPA